MLSSLKINNVAIIEESEITYENGLNVMTGETGSGKSIIIDSINAVLGNRTSHELIRDGSSTAKVAAVFENIGKSALDYLSSVGIDCPDNTLLIQRSITEKGNRSL